MTMPNDVPHDAAAAEGLVAGLSKCKDCGRPFRSEGSVVMSLDKILCVPCIGAALARITD
jgi:formylmethanofuran dehydrogenase subunit E